MQPNVKFLLRQFDNIVEQLADETSNVEELLDLRMELELRILDVLEDYVDSYSEDTEYKQAFNFLRVEMPVGDIKSLEGDGKRE